VISEKNDPIRKKRIAPVVLVAWAGMLLPLGFIGVRYVVSQRAKQVKDSHLHSMQQSFTQPFVSGELDKAAKSGDAGAFLAAVKQLPDGAPDARAYTAVVASVREGHLNILQCWLDQGWPINFFNAKRSILSDCLGVASYSENPEMVRFLLSKGADANCDESLLHAAYRKTDAAAEIAIVFINAGADLNQAFSQYTRPMSSHMPPYLIWSRVSDKGLAGYTALMLAARNGRADVAQSLLAKGASLWLRSCFGQTALDIAEEQDHKEVVALLTEAAKKQPETKNAGQRPTAVYVP
jgi:hypothetical protein